jgi:sugar phosphate permease
VTGLAVYSEGPVMQTALADVAGKTSIEMLFGLYFTIGAIMGEPWALLLGTLVDAYGFPVAFAVMGASQIAAGLCILPVRLGHTRAMVFADNRATPSRKA